MSRHRRTRPSTWKPGTIQVTRTLTAHLCIWQRCELAPDGGSFSMTVIA
jgi:hypothetical protein